MHWLTSTALSLSPSRFALALALTLSLSRSHSLSPSQHLQKPTCMQTQRGCRRVRGFRVEGFLEPVLLPTSSCFSVSGSGFRGLRVEGFRVRGLVGV